MANAFWDSSALVPICVSQQAGSATRALHERYEKIVWWGTPVEMRGAFARLLKTGSLSPNGHVQALVRLDKLRGSWREVDPTDTLRDRAELFVERFSIKGADSFQLAAAWIWSGGHPHGKPFIAEDLQLLATAVQLGFDGIEG